MIIMTYLFVIALNANGLNVAIRRHKEEEDEAVEVVSGRVA